ncbi:MAG: hypothetical protein VX938_10955, partial [Myxococcota bacterium]|nr:hypothetical protein [Myxococcota bacterium]
ALHDTLRDTCDGEATPRAIQDSRQRLTRALLLDRIGAYTTPVAQGALIRWVEPWDEALALIDDLYVCASCDQGLPGEIQLALSQGALSTMGQIRCAACEPSGMVAVADLEPVSRPLACAQLMLQAGEPRRTLELVVAAESSGVERAALYGLRGAAHLALSNPVQAAVYLRYALRRDPRDLQSRALLVEAEARCGLIASAMSHLDIIAEVRPSAGPRVEELRAELTPLRPSGISDPDGVELRCLQSMALADAGRMEEARQVFAGHGLADTSHPTVQVLHEEILGREDAGDSRFMTRRVRGMIGSRLPVALRALSRACTGKRGALGPS